jgi:uncharacterized protein
MPRAWRRPSLPPFALLLSLPLAGAPSAAPAATACDAPHGWAERTLCQYEEVERLDRRLAAAFADLATALPVADRERLRGEQRAWIADRDACRRQAQPAACLRRRYMDRIADLERRSERASLASRPPQPAAIEPFVRRARAIDRRLPQLRQRVADEAGGAAFLWLDGSQPVVLVEPGGGDGGHRLATRYYFDGGALFYVEGRADRAGFEAGEMLVWQDAAGRPPVGAGPLWPVRQRELLTRAATLLGRFAP